MGGIVTLHGDARHSETEVEPDDRRHQLKLLASVAHDGKEATFQVSRGEGSRSGFHVSFGEAANFYHEVRHVTHVMTDRQQMATLGHDAIADLLRTALCPDSIDFKVDVASGDTFAIYQFTEHAPFVVRMTPQQLHDARLHLHQATRRSTN
ncbi:hypothetical protein X739_00750 [Mesorhizobium sp. LNHC220B00]|nr:hypothetical protein [Mesorhizobium sp. LNHC220B00]ESY89055.1 hypothetical protein X739_00750 [Mesorhizobium sp. LNHC220B00]